MWPQSTERAFSHNCSSLQAIGLGRAWGRPPLREGECYMSDMLLRQIGIDPGAVASKPTNVTSYLNLLDIAGLLGGGGGLGGSMGKGMGGGADGAGVNETAGEESTVTADAASITALFALLDPSLGQTHTQIQTHTRTICIELPLSIAHKMRTRTYALSLPLSPRPSLPPPPLYSPIHTGPVFNEPFSFGRINVSAFLDLSTLPPWVFNASNTTLDVAELVRSNTVRHLCILRANLLIFSDTLILRAQRIRGTSDPSDPISACVFTLGITERNSGFKPNSGSTQRCVGWYARPPHDLITTSHRNTTQHSIAKHI
jgi:hypothetical protein